MALPLRLPIEPMLARAVPAVPDPDHPGQFSYEPKWDGFRCLAARDGSDVTLWSRSRRPLTDYFPEVADAVRRHLPPQVVVDGEIVVRTGEPGAERLDWEALSLRIHPAARRVRERAALTPAELVCFDLLALADVDLTPLPYATRRDALAQLLDGLPPEAGLHLTRATTHPAEARAWFERFEGAGLDGVVAKPLDAPYAEDKRVMYKIKHERTADCVVAGYRLYRTETDAIGSLLLGLYADGGTLHSVGVIGAFPLERRRELFAELQPLVTAWEGHPWAWAEPAAEAADNRDQSFPRTPTAAAHSRWNAKKDLSFTPLRPERVVEVRYDHMEGTRFRHTAQFVRWRPDREPESCTYAQLEEPVSYDLADVLGQQ